MRAMKDWELDLGNSLLELLYSVHIVIGEDDKVSWKLTKKGQFDV